MNPNTSLERKLKRKPLAGKKVVVACSGGKDSIALLFCLCRLRQELSLTLFAAHFNHGLRGEESDRDERFVTAFCEKEGVPLFLGREDVYALAKEKKLSLETAAREARYRFLFSVSKDADWIVTAHTASDQAETVLFHLLRGTGIKGLRGIWETRGKLFRPILSVTEQEVREYLDVYAVPYVEDSTNASEAYTRNRIRRRVLPELKALNPAFEESVLRLAASAAEDEEYLSSLAGEGLQKALLDGRLQKDVMLTLPLPVRKRVLALYLESKGLSVTWEGLQRANDLLLKPGSRLSIGEGFLFFDGESCYYQKKETHAPVCFLLTPEAGIWKETGVFFGEKGACQLKYRLFSPEEWDLEEKIHKNHYIFYLNYDTIHGKLFLRNRMAKDRIRLQKRRSRTLKKLYSEAHLTQNQRAKALLLSDDLGVCWAQFLGPDQRAAQAAGHTVCAGILEKTGKEDGYENG